MPTAFSNLLDLEELAKRKLPKATFDYIAGGAEDEITLRKNRDAYARWNLRPRVLIDVSRRDTSTTVLGTRVSMPILVAPTALQGLAHPDAEVATSRGTAAAGTVMVASTLSTRTLEDIAAAAPGTRWFQLYVYRNRKLTENLVSRAAKAGYRAIVLTVDTPILGRRERDETNQFTPPDGLGFPNVRAAGLDTIPPAEGGSALARYAADLLDPGVTWKDVDWLKSVSPLPVITKGILTAEDAALAVEHEVDGIGVSNHGGRQLDGSPATLDALPEVVEAVKGRAEVYVDGGVRRGTDVLKALALGARAVLVGRPVVWGLALGGAEGVQQVLERLRTEFDTAMAIAGRPTVADIGRNLVVREA